MKTEVLVLEYDIVNVSMKLKFTYCARQRVLPKTYQLLAQGERDDEIFAIELVLTLSKNIFTLLAFRRQILYRLYLTHLLTISIHQQQFLN